jgi:purine-binding chemotaxis protein CheW
MRKFTAATPQRQFVLFAVGGTEMALDVFAVQEVLRPREVTPVPRAPQFVEGVVEVRGTLVPVIDLRRRMEVDPSDADDERRLVLANVEEDRVGLIVDRVTEVLRVDETCIQPAPPLVAARAATRFPSILRLPDRLVLVLDATGLLSSDERIALRELEAALAEAAAEGGEDSEGETGSRGETVPGAAADDAPRGAGTETPRADAPLSDAEPGR